MRPLPLLLGGAVLLACASPRAPRDAGVVPQDPPLSPVHPHLAEPGCKPTAPIALAVEAGPLGADGVVRLSYEVELLYPAEDVWLEVHLPAGGHLVDQATLLRGPAQRGDRRDGSARVRLPQLSGIVELEAVMQIADPTEPSGLLRLSNTHTVRYGELELELPQLVVEGETSVVAPSVLRPGGRR